MAAARYVITIAGASPMWGTVRPMARRALCSDPFAPKALEDYRRALVQLSRQRLEVR